MEGQDTMKTLKAFRVDKDGRPHFLFHGNGGSTLVPQDCWIEADQKNVRDGAGERRYASGFHSLADSSSVDKWAAGTKNKYVFAQVEVRETWPKERSLSGAILSRYLYLSSVDWERAISAHSTY